MRRHLLLITLITFCSCHLQAQYNSQSSFAPAAMYAGGGYGAYSVALADLNGDGKADIVVANACASFTTGVCQDASVSVLLGNGDGTFQSAHTYLSGGNQAQSVAVADVNGDGRPDVLVLNACFSSAGTADCISTVGVLLGNGDGSLQNVQVYPSGGYGPCCSTSSFAVADVNGDGKPDIAVANGYADNFPEGAVSVLLGNGDGSFQSAIVNDSGGEDAVSVAIADANGDGKPDLLVANNCVNIIAGACGSIGVLLGYGDGSFQIPFSYSSGGYGTLSLVASDVNNDKNMDILVASAGSSILTAGNSSISVLLGNGDGTFQLAKYTYSAGGENTYDLTAADLNGDRNIDLIAALECGNDVCNDGGSVGILLGQGNGTFLTLSGFPSGAFYALSVAVGDLNGDGKPDVIVGNSCLALDTCTGIVGVLLNTSKASSNTVITSSPNPSVVGQAVTFDITVSGSQNSPTGNVTLESTGNAPITAPLVSGHATFVSSFPSSGTQTVNAIYSGDTTYSSGVSASFGQTVNAVIVAITGTPQQPVTRNSAGNFVTNVIVTNSGNAAISSIQVTSSGTTLGSAAPLSVPPAIKNLPAGGSTTITLTFPGSAVSSKSTTAPLKVAGSYAVTNSLNGNWSLSFRSVSLN